ncbi:MAG: hydroxyacid dehydrogenase [Firmicutes bacterium]|nr:hydroxyacid dehydrogenase [Bacillota bacterium]
MKSVLMGGNAIRNVYPAETRSELQKKAGLDTEQVFTGENWRSHTGELAEADAIFSTWGMPAFSEEEIRQYLPNVREVYYAAGSVQAFAKPFLHCGVRVFSAWAANAVPVAEFTVAQIILANTGYFQAARYHSCGDTKHSYPYGSLFPGNYGCRIGILGAGQIGTLVIRMLKAYRLEVLVFDPFLSDERAAELQVTKAPLETIFAECQTISNHLANNAQTVGMLNYETCFSRMKDNATFINTGRGAQVVEEDLVRALQEKPDATALLDVTWPEPPQPGHPFYSMPNVFLTPHIAGSKGDEVQRMSLYMLQEFDRVHSGEKPLYEVTEEMLAHMA